jgi:hypothetical protein
MPDWYIILICLTCLAIPFIDRVILYRKAFDKLEYPLYIGFGVWIEDPRKEKKQ